MNADAKSYWQDEGEERITATERMPTFEIVRDGWAQGLLEGQSSEFVIVSTTLRAFNAPRFSEKCNRAWQNNNPIYFHYTWDEYDSTTGYERRAQICAAKPFKAPDGEGIMLWIAMPISELGLSE